MVTSNRRFNVPETCRKFQIAGDLLDYRPYGSGHINDTFSAIYTQAGAKVRYVVQRLNTDIFKNPEGLMDNVLRVTRHLHTKIREKGLRDISRRALTLVPTLDGQCFHKDTQGNCWRVYYLVESTKTVEVVETPELAAAAARAFGEFQRMVVDLPGSRLCDVIPGFHDARKRFNNLEKAVDADVCNRAAAAKKEIDFVLKRKPIVSILANLQEKGELPERIAHNDTKINNVLFDEMSGEGICVIDLDTVMPGLALFDFGDMVRTAASTAMEDEQDLSRMELNRENFEALVKGYWSAAGSFLTPREKEYLAFSGKLITFIIGMRFLTDHLSGDTYFKIHRDGHNLDRCRTQFKLVASIESQEDELNAFVESL